VGSWSGSGAEDASERQLMLRLARGDGEALEPLVERHQARLYRIALSYLRDEAEALDVVQETFMKAFTHAGSWKQEAPVAPWLTRIAINAAVDRYRRGRRRRASEQPLEQDGREHSLEDESPSPERGVQGRELAERIGTAVRCLPERERAVFVLRHQEEMSLGEIAASLGLQIGTVKSTLHRAVHHLRERLAGVRP
jgi:RNA polymerase sigma-70 factor (ECF subfamily)